MTVTTTPSDGIKAQGAPGNEYMLICERHSASGAIGLLGGGVVVIDSAGATAAMTLPSTVKVGAMYKIYTASVAGGNHTLTLPSGMLFNGVADADVATFDAAHEQLEFIVESATRVTVTSNPAGIAFS
jgi:hypothetical protein